MAPSFCRLQSVHLVTDRIETLCDAEQFYAWKKDRED
jgi:hypothetical protein